MVRQMKKRKGIARKAKGHGTTRGLTRRQIGKGEEKGDDAGC